jgi:hypothetical protein
MDGSTIGWILLGVVLIILFYILFQYLTTSTTTVSSVNLNLNNIPIASTSITGPSNTSYTISAMVYVNSWDNTVPHTIVYAPNNGSVAPSLIGGEPTDKTNTNTYDFALFLDQNSPTLYCALGGTSLASNTASGNNATPSNLITVTNNFPLQTWVFVAISVNTNVVDCYLNGKLVMSQQVMQNGKVVSPTFSQMYLGNGNGKGWDCQLQNFKRVPTSSSPQQIWSQYMSYASYKLPSVSQYGLQLDLTQNKAVTNSFTIF